MVPSMLRLEHYLRTSRTLFISYLNGMYDHWWWINMRLGYLFSSLSAANMSYTYLLPDCMTVPIYLLQTVCAYLSSIRLPDCAYLSSIRLSDCAYISSIHLSECAHLSSTRLSVGAQLSSTRLSDYLHVCLTISLSTNVFNCVYFCLHVCLTISESTYQFV